MSEADPTGLLRRVERLALVLTAAAAAVAWIVPAPVGGVPAAAGVAGGALLAGVSYWAIKRGITGLADAVVRRGDARHATPRGFVLFVLRYALLALLAYVMISRLRLPPIGLLCGASVMPVAAAIEFMRSQKERAHK